MRVKIKMKKRGHSFVIGMWRLFQGPIQSSSSSDCVWSLGNSKGSLMSSLSTTDSCSSVLFNLLPPDFAAMLSASTADEAKETLHGLVFSLSLDDAPVENVFSGTFSSCVTANLSSFLKCFPSLTGEVTFKLFERQLRRVLITDPFWAM